MLAIGVGVALCIEGAAYALAPAFVRRAYASIQVMSDLTLRVSGVMVLGAGVVLVALLR